MMTFLSQIASFFTGLFLSLIHHEHTPATKCGKVDDLKWCYYAGSPEQKRNVIFLHGFGNDDVSWGWNSVTKRILENWQQKNTPQPHVIALSFGKIWWYDHKKGEAMSKFLVSFEKEHAIQNHPRTIYGDSMGGHNSFRWASEHPELFERMALICPAMPLSFAVKKENAYEGLWPFNFAADLLIADLYSSFEGKERNPITTTKYFEKLKALQKIHVVVSNKDHFGFYSGGLTLHAAMKNIPDVSITLEEQPIRHCEAEVSKLAPFLSGI
jgi:pimeloyl-ACP methyl ester carboxylesterase